MRVAASLAYLAVTGLACVPMFTWPDSPLSGLPVFVMTLPWSVILGIPISILWPDLADTRAGFLIVAVVNVTLNTLLIFWMIGTVRSDARS